MSTDRLGIWSKDEILQAMRAIDMANRSIADQIDTPEMHLYRRGFEAALRAVAEAFGMQIEWEK